MPTEYSVAAEAKPLLSTRFGHPKAAKPSADGKALGVARRNETLESTWRTITERRAHPLKKSDTRDTPGGVFREEPTAAMRKSETLIERAGAASRGRPRREASKGQEELNRRVEAFIRKFNQEMRLQPAGVAEAPHGDDQPRQPLEEETNLGQGITTTSMSLF